MTDPRNQHTTVLCIGSDALALHFRKQMLKRQGYRVVTAGSGNDGLHLFAREAVEIVLLDQSLEGSEAPLVAGQMRRKRPDIPIILLSEKEGHLDGTMAVVDVIVSEAKGMDLLMGAVQEVLLKKNGHHLSA